MSYLPISFGVTRDTTSCKGGLQGKFFSSARFLDDNALQSWTKSLATLPMWSAEIGTARVMKPYTSGYYTIDFHVMRILPKTYHHMISITSSRTGSSTRVYKNTKVAGVPKSYENDRDISGFISYQWVH